MNKATGWPPPHVKVAADLRFHREGRAGRAHRPAAPPQRRTGDPGPRWYRDRRRTPPLARPARPIALSRRTASWGGRYGARRSPVPRSGNAPRGARAGPCDPAQANRQPRCWRRAVR